MGHAHIMIKNIHNLRLLHTHDWKSNVSQIYGQHIKVFDNIRVPMTHHNDSNWTLIKPKLHAPQPHWTVHMCMLYIEKQPYPNDKQKGQMRLTALTLSLPQNAWWDIQVVAASPVSQLLCVLVSFWLLASCLHLPHVILQTYDEWQSIFFRLYLVLLGVWLLWNWPLHYATLKLIETSWNVALRILLIRQSDVSDQVLQESCTCVLTL